MVGRTGSSVESSKELAACDEEGEGEGRVSFAVAFVSRARDVSAPASRSTLDQGMKLTEFGFLPSIACWEDEQEREARNS